MSKNNDHTELTLNITEDHTGEYPVLQESDVLDASAPTGLNGTSPAPQRQTEPPVKAAFWLAHLEAEVTRMHAKWQSIETEFKSREARISRLHEEIKARDTTIANLTVEVQREAASLKVADERLTSKDEEIAALLDDRRARDERIAALATELADSGVAHKATREQIERAEAEAARLNDAVQREQTAAARVVERNQQLLAEHNLLQVKVQDLETYIDGRRNRWDELNTKLKDYENTLIEADKTINARNAVLARHDKEQQKLADRINELERQCAELGARRKESEEAYDELQKILAANLEHSEQLKAEYAVRAQESEQAALQSVNNQLRIDSLERDIKSRDENIAALNAEIEQSKLGVGELATAKVALVKRVDELAQELAAGSQQMQTLRDDLRMSQDQLRLAQEQSTDRSSQLTSSQEALAQKSRHVEQLTGELRAVEKDTARLRIELDTLAEHATELGRSRGEAMAESERLKLALTAQEDLRAKLEDELRAKQATADLLERSVDRITDLGASLAALDQQMNGSAGGHNKRGAEPTVLHLSDFVATVAADDEVAAAAPRPLAAATAETLPMYPQLDDELEQDIVDIGEPTDSETNRKLIITIGGEAFHYPLVKEHMTIGRGRGSDIRIASHFVSRVHAKINTDGGATIIEDAGSKNGITVNSERVLRRVLRDGDVINLGYDLDLRFVDATH